MSDYSLIFYDEQGEVPKVASSDTATTISRSSTPSSRPGRPVAAVSSDIQYKQGLQQLHSTGGGRLDSAASEAARAARNALQERANNARLIAAPFRRHASIYELSRVNLSPTDLHVDRDAAAQHLKGIIRQHELSGAELDVIYLTSLDLVRATTDDRMQQGFGLLQRMFLSQDVPNAMRAGCAEYILSQPDDRHLLYLPRLYDAMTRTGKASYGLGLPVSSQLLQIISGLVVLCNEAEQSETIVEPSMILEYRQANMQALQLLRTCIQFQTFAYQESTQEMLDTCAELFRIIKSDEEIRALFAVLDACIGRGDVLLPMLSGLLESICTAYAASNSPDRPDVKGSVMQTVNRLLVTHAPSIVLGTFTDVLEKRGCESPGDCLVIVGALLLIERILADSSYSRSIGLDVQRLLDIISRADITGSLETLPSSAALLLTLVHRPHLQPALLAEMDWTALVQSVEKIYRIIIEAADKRLSEHRIGLEDAIRKLGNIPQLSPAQSDCLELLKLKLGNKLPFDITELTLRNYERPKGPNDVYTHLQRLVNILDSNSVAPQLKLRVVEILEDMVQDTQQTDVELAKTCIQSAEMALAYHLLDSSLVTRLVSLVTDFVTGVAIEDDGMFYQSATYLVAKLRPTLDPNDSPEPQMEIKERSVRPMATGLVVLLMRSINTSAARTMFLIKAFLNYLNSGDLNPSAAVMLLRVLFRLRSDISHRIFLIASPEGEGLAATLERSTDMTAAIGRRPSKASTLSETGPVWKYGEIRGLPEDPPSIVSPVLVSEQAFMTDTSSSVDIHAWLAFVIRVLAEGADWEIYSYTIVHLGAQLTNQTLFTDSGAQLLELRALLCNQLIQQTVPKPPDSTDLRQADVAVCLYHILTMLIGYYQLFSRPETEEIISAFIMGLTAWDRTTVPCIHALTLCCYELPVSLQRDLVRIVSQMATIVTKSDAAVHVLEFLAGLSRLTELAQSFRGDEIKIVFGVCFSYIDYVRGKKFDEAQAKIKVASLPRDARPVQPLPNADEAPEYVFALAYHVISFWFITLQKSDREKYLRWMQSRLLSTDENGKREDQALVTLDLGWRLTKRITKSISVVPPQNGKDTYSALATQYSLLSVEHAPEAKTAHFIDRRPTGTDEWTIEAEPNAKDIDLLRSQVLSADEDPFPDTKSAEVIETSDAYSRALAMLDRTSPIDFFRAGVLYVGEDQTTEGPILQNLMGSPDYNAMLASLGERLPLLGLRHNTCGLDTSEALVDGPHTIWHRDEVTALIFHVATYMPTDPADPKCIRKKSHIGNDFVNIIFNNSGSPWKFDTIPSAFDYVYVVVSPEARATFIETRTRLKVQKDFFEKSWFKVQVMTKPGFPNLGSASETKVVSGQALGLYVRNLVLNACIFANVMALKDGGGMREGSSWRARLGMLGNIRERFTRKETTKETNGKKKA